MIETNTDSTQPSQFWGALSEELDRWAERGQIATFWWRDDDATQPSARLDQLLNLAAGTPIALAIIPMSAEPALASRIAGAATVTIMQHGFTHANHAPNNDRKTEFGNHRSNDVMVDEIARGAAHLGDIFQSNLPGIFVPPWNRIADTVVAQLPTAGISALSSIGPCLPNPPVSQLNVHVDIIDWRGHRGFRGSETIDCMVDHLSRRRLGLIDTTEATGLLTHHLDHDDACWQFIVDLLALTAAHPAAHWTSATEELEGQ